MERSRLVLAGLLQLLAILYAAWFFGDRQYTLALLVFALPPILLIAAVTTLILFLTEVTSNTATAATFIPILGGVAMGIGADPMALLIPAAFAATCAFMLPVGTPPNAIVFGTGAVTIGQMARGGVVLNVVGIFLITAFIYLVGGIALGITFG